MRSIGSRCLGVGTPMRSDPLQATRDSLRRAHERSKASRDHRSPEEIAAFPDFEEEPVPFEAWLADPYYLGLPELSEIQLDAMLHAERVLYEPTFDALGWKEVRPVFEIDLAWGKLSAPVKTTSPGSSFHESSTCCSA